jgi:hypothetical protein
LVDQVTLVSYAEELVIVLRGALVAMLGFRQVRRTVLPAGGRGSGMACYRNHRYPGLDRNHFQMRSKARARTKPFRGEFRMLVLACGGIEPPYGGIKSA